ncbi:MAG: helix-turn-helix domain-containing protein [Minwuia sp.]|nr:helix-turn-helix domain-containing protein [Minwuia sp.]
MIGALDNRTPSASAATVVTDISRIPSGRRIDAWTESIYEHYYPLDLTPTDDAFSHGELRILDLPGIRLGALDSDGYTVHRRRNHVASNGSDFYFMPVPLHRSLGLQQDGRDTVLHPGDAAVINTSNAYSYLQHSRNRVATLRLDGPQVRARVPFIDDLVAVPFRRNGVLTGVLIDFVLSVMRCAEDLDARAAQVLSDQTLDLIGLALTADADAGESAETSVRLAHIRRINREIDANLGQFELGIEVIAERLGLSRRYVQRLVAERGATVSGLIRDRRIAAARRKLADPALSSMSVASIGHAVGFADSTRFSRVFRETTARSPGEYRREIQAGMQSGEATAN